MLHKFVATHHAFAGDSLLRFVKRIVSAPAPLPLMQCGEGVFASIVRGDEGIAPYEVLPYLFVGADAHIGPPYSATTHCR